MKYGIVVLLAAVVTLALPVAALAEDAAPHYEAGRKAEAGRDFKAAFAHYEKVLDIDEDFKDAFERWEFCELLSQWQGGLEGEITAMDLVRLGEASVKARESAGFVENGAYTGPNSEEWFEEEAAIYVEAIAKDAGCAEAHGHLALLHYSNLTNGGSLDTVIKETFKLLETTTVKDRLKHAVEGFQVYGNLRIAKQELKETLTAAGKAQRKGENARAAKVLEEAAGGEIPDAFRTLLYLNAGRLHLKAKDRDAAKASFAEALNHAACKFTIDARLTLAALAVGDGDLKGAIEHLRGAVAEGSDACKGIDAQREKAFKALFNAEDESIRDAAEKLTNARQGDDPIRQSLFNAMEKAAKEEKRVLILWYGPYCPYVMAMEERLAHPEVRAAIEKDFVLLRIDLGSHHRGDTVNEDFGDPVGANGVPSFLVLTAEGEIVDTGRDTDLMNVTYRCYGVELIVEWLGKMAD